jgi:hypothetical protein
MKKYRYNNIFVQINVLSHKILRFNLGYSNQPTGGKNMIKKQIFNKILLFCGLL